MNELFFAVERNPPATALEIAAAEGALKVRLPQDYVAFLTTSNGAVGPIGESAYVDLWRCDELKERNDAYLVREYAPHLIVFGSDGGDTAYAFDVSRDSIIVETRFIGMGSEETNVIGSWRDFVQFLLRR